MVIVALRLVVFPLGILGLFYIEIHGPTYASVLCQLYEVNQTWVLVESLEELMNQQQTIHNSHNMKLLTWFK